jgi:hypothetical protein
VQREGLLEERAVVARVGRPREAQVLHEAAEHDGVVAFVAARGRGVEQQLVVDLAGPLGRDHEDLRSSPQQPVRHEQHRPEQRELEERPPHGAQHRRDETYTKLTNSG